VPHRTAEGYRIVVLQGFHIVQDQPESQLSLLDDRAIHTVSGVREFGAYERERIRVRQWSSVAMHGSYQTLNLEEPMLQLEKRNGIAR
jgi:hypothetical protein